jgi:hypothetical protein
MRILGLDIATKTGWAIYDDSQPLTAKGHVTNRIEMGTVHLRGGNADEQIQFMHDDLYPIIQNAEPDWMVIEQPLNWIKNYSKKGYDLAGQIKGSGPNAKTVMTLNRLYGAAVIMGIIQCGTKVLTVQPQSWQAMMGTRAQNDAIRYYLDDKGKRHDGSMKRVVKHYCSLIGIEGGDDNARDAAVIALWGNAAASKREMLEKA